MKRNVIVAVMLLLLFIPTIVGAAENDIRIFINDTQLAIASGLGKPFIDSQSRTQIPLRAISEGLGHWVDWDGATKTVTISKSESEKIQVVIGDDKVITPKGPILMDTKAVIIGARTYVPLRFVSQALGYNVDYQWKGYHSISITDPDAKQAFYRPDHQSLPEEIANWVDYSKELPAVQEKQFNGSRYVLITEGMKPTGGYSVEVVEVAAREGFLEIRVKSVEPGEDEMVTQALTYPYDLIIIEEKELPLRFVDVDNADRHFMSLLGIDEIDRPIAASSGWINIFSPEPDQEIEGNIKITGIASVFEGTVSYELIAETGEMLLSGFTTAAMGDWGYFEEEVQIPQGLTDTQLFLELYSESMEDGSKMFKISIPLTIKN
ncbi:MAG: Gmad2 immunoglobulin-like domain-containing protein [Bacillota bacterium]